MPAGRAGRLDLPGQIGRVGGRRRAGRRRRGDQGRRPDRADQPAGDIRAYFAATDPSLSLPAWKLFEPGADLSELAGKIVVVGASASLLSDVVATPLNPVDARRRGAGAIDRADPRRRRIAASRLGARRRGGGVRPCCRSRSSSRRRCCRRCGAPFSAHWPSRRMAGGSWLAFTHYGWLLDPDHAQLLIRRGLSRRRAGALQPEATSVERDALAFRAVRVACGGRATGRAPGSHSTGRAAAHAHLDVLRHPLLHHDLGGPVGGRADLVPQRISDADDGGRARRDGHRRQVHGRRDHGVLERAARRRRPRRSRGQRRPGDAQDPCGLESAVGRAGRPNPVTPFTR